MTPDPRYVDSTDPRAILRAWGGADADTATMDMGGWTDTDEDAFRAAVQAESLRAAGEPLAYIVIERVKGAHTMNTSQNRPTYHIDVKYIDRYGSAVWEPAPGESTGLSLEMAEEMVERGIPTMDGSEPEWGDVRVVEDLAGE